MEFLTNERITYISHQNNPDHDIMPASIEMIRAHLTPFAQVLAGATEVEQIEPWLLQVLPGELAPHAISEMNRAKRTHHDAPLPYAKEGLMEYLIAEITELAGNITTSEHGHVITPFDVVFGVSRDEELRQLFGYPEDMSSLHVTVNINGNIFTHAMTEEMFFGLLLFSYLTNNNFHMTIYGVEVDPSYMGDNRNRYIDDNEDVHEFGSDRIYIITLDNNRGYYFKTTDFMQGFVTGANWIGVDHHTYWKVLEKYDADKEQRFTLTF